MGIVGANRRGACPLAIPVHPLPCPPATKVPGVGEGKGEAAAAALPKRGDQPTSLLT